MGRCTLPAHFLYCGRAAAVAVRPRARLAHPRPPARGQRPRLQSTDDHAPALSRSDRRGPDRAGVGDRRSSSPHGPVRTGRGARTGGTARRGSTAIGSSRTSRRSSAPEMEGRLTGTAGNKRAQAYIARTVQAARAPADRRRFRTEVLVHQQTRRREGISGRDQSRRPACPGPRTRDRYVLVTAHYDHVGVRNGAMLPRRGRQRVGRRGDARSRAVVHDAGRRRCRWSSSRSTPRRRACRAPAHFVAHPPVPLDRISAVVNMDMIGRGDKNVLFVAGTHTESGAQAAGGGRRRRDAPIDVTLRPRSARAARRAMTGPSRPITVRSTPPRCRFSISASRIMPTITSPRTPPTRFPRAVLRRGGGSGARARCSGWPMPRRSAAASAGASAQRKEDALTPEEQANRLGRRRRQSAGAGPARAGGEHQQRLDEFRGRARGRRRLPRRARTRSASPARWIDGAPFKRAGHLVAERRGPRPPRAADRPSRHRVRAGQPVPAVPAHRRPHARAAPASST